MGKRRMSAADRYMAAASFLPGRLRQAAMALPEESQARAEEIRLRAGRPLGVLLPEGETALGPVVSPEDLELLCDRAAEFSRYAAVETLREGYLPVRGGFRVGFCGTAVMKGAVNTNLRELSSAAIRISREHRGIAEELVPGLFQEGRFQSTVILSPPGGGKTTLLRDLVRCLSEGSGERPPQRVSLIDERGEVAVMYRGEAQMEVGRCTDVLDACPKAVGIPMVLRAMNPQVIALDEISAREDLAAMVQAVGCGTALLATIHAETVEELRSKPLCRELLAAGLFHYAVVIRREEGDRRYETEVLA